MAHLGFVAFTMLKPAVKAVEPQSSMVSALVGGLVNHLPSLRVTAAATTAVAAVAGVYLLRRDRNTDLTITVDPIMTSPEGAVHGSPILEGGRLPAGQVKLAIKRGNELMIVGSGLRMEDHLITPTHNVIAGHELYMVTERERIRVDTAQELFLAADVSAFPMPEASWALAGVSRIKMAPLASEKTVTITSGCDQTYSIGRLRSTHPLGRVHYVASTKPGYSGSAYMDGQSCVGMHNHGGAMSGGYEILYLWCRLKHVLQQIPESSEDFMRRLSKKKRLQFEDLDQDYSVVRQQSGHYHLTTKQVSERLKQQAEENRRNPGNWSGEIEEEQLRQELRDRRAYQPPRRQGPYEDSDDEDNDRGYNHDTDHEDDYADEYDMRPESAFVGEGHRPVTAPNRPTFQGLPRPQPRSRVAFALPTNNAQQQPTGQQGSIRAPRTQLNMLRLLLRDQSRRAGLSNREAAIMSAEFLEQWRTRLMLPSPNTVQQTPQPEQNARASTTN